MGFMSFKFGCCDHIITPRTVVLLATSSYTSPGPDAVCILFVYSIFRIVSYARTEGIGQELGFLL